MGKTNKNDFNDLVGVVCALEALKLKNKLSLKLWQGLKSENKIEKLVEKLDPEYFTDHLSKLIELDSGTLRSYWCSLNLSQQKSENTKWKQLEVEESDIEGEVKKFIKKNLYDDRLISIAEKVLRYSKLLDKISDFWEKYQNHKKAENIKNEKELYASWSDLFVVLVSPVTEEDGNYQLRTMNLNHEFNINEKIYSHMDKSARETFFKYVNTQMEEIRCCDYRDFKNAGIRSLNCTYFNNLDQLKSCGDHPAALLCGCRSGLQYQVINNKENKIIGMVTIYFPLYDLWENFNLEEFGFLFGESRDSAEDIYMGFLRKEQVDNKVDSNRLRIAKLLINHEETYYKNVITSLAFLSSESWSRLKTRTMKAIPPKIKLVINNLKNMGSFNIDDYEEIIIWFRGYLKTIDLNTCGVKTEINTIDDCVSQIKIDNHRKKWIDLFNETMKKEKNHTNIYNHFSEDKDIDNFENQVKNDLFEKLKYIFIELNHIEEFKIRPPKFQFMNENLDCIIDLFCFKIFINTSQACEIFIKTTAIFKNKLEISKCAISENLSSISIENYSTKILDSLQLTEVD